MELDQLLDLLSKVSMKLLPVLGALLLFYLIVLIRRVIETMKKVDKSMDSLQDTIDITNRQLNALDAPLNTINSLSETIDNVHETTKHYARSAMVAAIDNFGNIKDWAFNKVNENKEPNKSGSDINEQ